MAIAGGEEIMYMTWIYAAGTVAVVTFITLLTAIMMQTIYFVVCHTIDKYKSRRAEKAVRETFKRIFLGEQKKEDK